MLPILEKGGLRAGKDFFLAYCPERVLPGTIIREIAENDRIIGGMIGETTLAMLYVPLFFYIFDRLKESREAKRAPLSQAADAAPAPHEGD